MGPESTVWAENRSRSMPGPLRSVWDGSNPLQGAVPGQKSQKVCPKTARLSHDYYYGYGHGLGHVMALVYHNNVIQLTMMSMRFACTSNNMQVPAQSRPEGNLKLVKSGPKAVPKWDQGWSQVWSRPDFQVVPKTSKMFRNGFRIDALG